MTSLFSIPMTTLMQALLAAFILVTLVVAALALKHRLLLKLGMRNVPRRRAQSVLIVLGLMLATAIVTSAFATGDTLSYSIRSLAVTQLGSIDETVSTRPVDKRALQRVRAAPVFFSQSVSGQVARLLRPGNLADGVTGIVEEPAAIQDLTSRQTKAAAGFIGVTDRYPGAFGALTPQTGQTVHIGELGARQVYINQNAADALNAHAGDRIVVYVAGKPVAMTIRAVVRNEGLATGFWGQALQTNPEVIMPLARAQALTGHPGQITTVLVSNRGDALGGEALSDRVAHALAPLHGYKVNKIKQTILNAANQAGSEFTAGFITFGLFSIASGIILIVLIFLMLAAERRSELGIARAVGTKRRHLIQQFLFEGYIYDLAASLVGVALGIVIGLGLVQVIAAVLGSNVGVTLQRHIEPRSMVVAFCLGALVTFITVVGASWRASRLNIVAAIRDLPDDLNVDGSIRAAFGRPVRDLATGWRRLRRSGPFSLMQRLRSGLAAWVIAPWHFLTAFRVFISRGPVPLAIGYLVFQMGNGDKQAFPYTLGISLMLIGAALLVRWALAGAGVRARVRNRIGYTLAGLSLVGFWLLPFDFFRSDLSVGIEMFFLSGMMLMLGGVWTVMYNLDILAAGLTRMAGSVRGLAPILRTAITYPTQHRLRTGLTVFMFALVVFALMVQAVLIGSFSAQGLNLNADAGGYQVFGDTSPTAPIAHVQRQVEANPALRGRIESAGGVGIMSVDLSQGTGKKMRYFANVADGDYLAGTHFTLHSRANGYSSDSQVWRALATPGYAVIDTMYIPSATATSGTLIHGVRYSDAHFKPFRVNMQDRRTGKVIALTVIGVIDPKLDVDAGVYISAATLAAAHDAPLAEQRYYFRVRPGQDVHQAALALGAAFLGNGLDVQETQKVFDQNRSLEIGFNSMLEGFMALGLIVGIAALGVIATRSVVERRQEIGMLRAIGFRRQTVLRTFLLESSIICLLGALIGTVLGVLLGYQVIAYFAKSDTGLHFVVPWLEVGGIVIATYLASLLTTYLPAWQASRVYPAEALRYE